MPRFSFQTIITLLPIILQIIASVEAIIGAGKGAVKKSLALKAVDGIIDTMAGLGVLHLVEDDTVNAKEVAAVLIDRLVAVNNTAGIFTAGKAKI